jgi:hypothetical protein
MTRTPPAATLADGLIRELDRALRTVVAGNVAQRDYPARVPTPGPGRRGICLTGQSCRWPRRHITAGLPARDPPCEACRGADEADHLAQCGAACRSAATACWSALVCRIIRDQRLASLAGDRTVWVSSPRPAAVSTTSSRTCAVARRRARGSSSTDTARGKRVREAPTQAVPPADSRRDAQHCTRDDPNGVSLVIGLLAGWRLY